jgi:hypothetical protein
MTKKQQVIGWTMAIVLALSIYTMGWAKESVCERLERTVGQNTEIVILKNLFEERNYLQGVIGRRLQWNIDAKAYNNRVPIHMFLQHRNLTVLGEVWVEKRSDGIYVCEDTCDYTAGEVVKARENRCNWIHKQ